MNRQQAIGIVLSRCTDKMREELEYRVENVVDEDPEQKYDILDAFVDFRRHAENNAYSGDKGAKKDYQWCLRVEIELGVWTEITKEQMREACRNGLGIRPSHFPKLDGKIYDNVMPWSVFESRLEQ